MFRRIRLTTSAYRIQALFLVSILMLGATLLSRPAPAQAHCDAINGPVVTAARQALDSGDVRPILAYVQPDAEAELTTAFRQALEVRQLGGEAQEVADRYFFETAVRLHRMGEGAPYTGLKMDTDHGPALAAADEALETGSLQPIDAVVKEAIHTGLTQKYQAVLGARQREAKEGTVAAARERAEAELMFEKYVYELYQTALGLAADAEGGPAGHAHGTEVQMPSADAHGD